MSKSTPNLKILAELLQTALPPVIKVVSKNATLPVLQTVYLACDPNGDVTLAGTDLETGVTVRVTGEVNAPFAACVPGATFASLVATTGATSEFTYDEASATLHMKSDGTKSKIKCIAGDEFPPLAIESATEIGKVPTGVLKNVLKSVVIASSVDESRPMLMGVQLANINGVTTLTAADGFRLATYRLENYKFNFPTKKNDKDEEKEVEAIIPRAAVLNLIAALPDGTGDVTISMTENTIVFEWDKTTVRTQLVSGQFPDWPGIFPAAWKHELTVNKKEFQSAVKRAEIFARETVAHVLRFEPGENGSGITIAGEDAETGRGETFLEDADFPLEVFGLNVSFTRQGLEAIEGEKVSMRLNARNAPTLLTNGSDAYRYLIMPMHLEDKKDQEAAAAAVAAADEVQQAE
jgi:DNA polymerase III subunit beta